MPEANKATGLCSGIVFPNAKRRWGNRNVLNQVWLGILPWAYCVSPLLTLLVNYWVLGGTVKVGRGRGTTAGAGQGAVLGKLCLEERDSAGGQVHAQLSGSAALGLLTVLSHPFFLPKSELCAAPSLSLIQPHPLLHFTLPDAIHPLH